MIIEHFYPSTALLQQDLLKDVLYDLSVSLSGRERASLAVSGGNSPKPFYQMLSLAELDWGRVDVALVDERWVESNHPGSNTGMIAATLLQSNAAAARFVPIKNDASKPTAGLEQAEQQYRDLILPFDLVLLGMGPDGHTASLFPNSEGLKQALEGDALLAAITAQKTAVTGDHLERISLSVSGICRSKKIMLLIGGEEKLKVYQAAKEHADFFSTPIAAVLNQNQVDVHVYWAP